jgi:hypothetical protein
MRLNAQVIVNLASSTLVLVAALAVTLLFPANLSMGTRVLIGLLAVLYFLFRVFRIVKYQGEYDKRQSELGLKREDNGQ